MLLDPKQSDRQELSKPEQSELGSEDFYFEGPFLVFTAAYHLNRGFCCSSDCRHCPYR